MEMNKHLHVSRSWRKSCKRWFG